MAKIFNLSSNHLILAIGFRFDVSSLEMFPELHVLTVSGLEMFLELHFLAFNDFFISFDLLYRCFKDCKCALQHLILVL